MVHERRQSTRFRSPKYMAIACFMFYANVLLVQLVNGFSNCCHYRRCPPSLTLLAGAFSEAKKSSSVNSLEALQLYSKIEDGEEDTSSSNNNESNDHNNNNHHGSFLESPIDDERRPRRPYIPPLPQKNDNFWTDWGIEMYDPTPIFPDTVDSVTDAALDAIVGTIYGKQCLNPNSASNAMTTTLYGYRPVRTERDAGRIGIEIDGAASLFPKNSSKPRRTTARSSSSRNSDVRVKTTTLSDYTALRHVSLVLAGKLAQGPWKDYEDNGAKTSTNRKKKSTSAGALGKEKDGPKERPVAVYFNTVRQALMASRELQMLKRKALENSDDDMARVYDEYVSIVCLSQDHEIPQNMRRPKQQYKKLSTGKVVASRGFILVVQPTDFNTEFRPPGPAIDAVSSLQKLAARAAIEELPTVLLSPRFLVQSGYPGQDQSLYQQSSSYGGIEPPRGPTPWLMRDFSPPVFCWVGNALALSPHKNRTNSSKPRKQQHDDDHESDDEHVTSKECHFSKVVLIQSVMHQDHPWHLFAVKECITSNVQPGSGSSLSSCKNPGGEEQAIYQVSTSHEYLASTKTSSGRPTKNIIRQIMSEWSSSGDREEEEEEEEDELYGAHH